MCTFASHACALSFQTYSLSSLNVETHSHPLLCIWFVPYMVNFLMTLSALRKYFNTELSKLKIVRIYSSLYLLLFTAVCTRFISGASKVVLNSLLTQSDLFLGTGHSTKCFTWSIWLGIFKKYSFLVNVVLI